MGQSIPQEASDNENVFTNQLGEYFSQARTGFAGDVKIRFDRYRSALGSDSGMFSVNTRYSHLRKRQKLRSVPVLNTSRSLINFPSLFAPFRSYMGQHSVLSTRI